MVANSNSGFNPTMSVQIFSICTNVQRGTFVLVSIRSLKRLSVLVSALACRQTQLQSTLCPFWMGAQLPVGNKVKDGLRIGAGRGEVLGCNSYSRDGCFDLCHGCFVKYLLSSLETESELFLVSTPTSKLGIHTPLM